MSKWISVILSLPLIGHTVLIWDEQFKCVDIAMRQSPDNELPWISRSNEGWYEEDVTHWMPLPEAPEE